VQKVVAVQLEALHEVERDLDVAGFGDRDGLVELDHGEPVTRASSPDSAAIRCQSGGSSTCSDAGCCLEAPERERRPPGRALPFR
jgi:hypothetical protein